jgi:hypothetical protein
MDWPLSIVGADGVMAPAVRVGSTVTESVAEDTVGALVEASVTV